jgi:hypothetical protein
VGGSRRSVVMTDDKGSSDDALQPRRRGGYKPEIPDPHLNPNPESRNPNPNLNLNPNSELPNLFLNPKTLNPYLELRNPT